MNKIVVTGRLTKDVDLRSGDVAIASFGVASNGRKKEETNFFDCKAFRGLAETINKYFKKGDGIVVYGTMRQYAYQKQDGTTMRGWEVIVDDIDFVGGNAQHSEPQEEEKPVEEQVVGELPF